MSTPRLLRAAAAVALVLAASTVVHAATAVEVDARVVCIFFVVADGLAILRSQPMRRVV
jgi:hypothetical protein